MSVFVDAHVHLHDCFDLDEFLVAAAGNFRAHSQNRNDSYSRFVLCLTETYGTDYYSRLLQRALAEIPTSGTAETEWRFRVGADSRSILAAHPRHGELEIVAGRQIVTAERLEILALGFLDRLEDGLSAHAVIESVTAGGAIPVLPWGFGKWLGRRRRVIESLIEEFDNGRVYLGDNGGRSAILPTPPEFVLAEARGMRILPGSDPLPFDSEYNRAGSYGFCVDKLPVLDAAWPDLCRMLQQGDGELKPFGRLESPIRFARNQIAMQYRTRLANRKRTA